MFETEFHKSWEAQILEFHNIQCIDDILAFFYKVNIRSFAWENNVRFLGAERTGELKLSLINTEIAFCMECMETGAKH